MDTRRLSKRLAERRRAVRLLQHGYTQQTVATRLGRSRSWVVRCSTRYRQLGDQGLQPKPIPGRRPRLTRAQEQDLREAIARWLEGAARAAAEEARAAAHQAEAEAREDLPLNWDKSPPSPSSPRRYAKYLWYLARYRSLARSELRKASPQRTTRALSRYVNDLLTTRFGIAFHRGHRWRLLKRLGLRHVPQQGWILETPAHRSGSEGS